MMEWFKLFPKDGAARIYGMSLEEKGAWVERFFMALLMERRGLDELADEMMDERERYLEVQREFGRDGGGKHKGKRRKGKRDTEKAPYRHPKGTLKGASRHPIGTPKGASREPRPIDTDTDTDTDNYPIVFNPSGDRLTHAHARVGDASGGGGAAGEADAKGEDSSSGGFSVGSVGSVGSGSVGDARGATGTGGGEGAAGAAGKESTYGSGGDEAGGGGGAWDVEKALSNPCEGARRLGVDGLAPFAVRYCREMDAKKAGKTYRDAVLKHRKKFREVLSAFVDDVEAGRFKPENRGAGFVARLKKAGVVA